MQLPDLSFVAGDYKFYELDPFLTLYTSIFFIIFFSVYICFTVNAVLLFGQDLEMFSTVFCVYHDEHRQRQKEIEMAASLN